MNIGKMGENLSIMSAGAVGENWSSINSGEVVKGMVSRDFSPPFFLSN
jgi:hypothetical protein